MKKTLLVMGFLIATLLIGLTMRSTIGVAMAQPAQGEPCPNSGGWTKIDSDDMSSHPVAGATEYCYKDGDGRFFSDDPLDWEYNREDEVIMEGRSKGLSHWSYYIPPQPSPSPTVRPTPDPSGSPRPSVSPSPTTRPSPSPKVDHPTISLNLPGFVCGVNHVTFTGGYDFQIVDREHYIKFFINGSEIGVTFDGTNWSTAEVTLDPNNYEIKVELWAVGQADRLVASQESNFTINACGGGGSNGGGGGSSNGGSGGSSSSTTSQGQVLGATTMAGTGVAEDVIMSVLGLSGSLMTAAGTVLYGKNKKK